MKHLIILLSLATFANASPNPNIIFILADDLGYNEVGAYGQEKIKTPHLDRLASEGVRFTRHYTGAPVCAPARAVLLTGQHTGHCEIRNNKEHKGKPIFDGQHPLSAEAITFFTLFKNHGYRTGAFGKWGVGNGDTTGAPAKQGIDTFLGYLCQRNAHSFYPPYLDSNDGRIPINDPPIPGHLRKPEGEIRAEDYRAKNYAPDLIREKALEFLYENKDRPFLLYLPFIEPHVAIHPPQQWIDQYPEDWDKDREPYRGEHGYLPHPRPRAAYAAMISHLDDHVGAILQTLDDLDLTKNTLVIFTSDNGPTLPGNTASGYHVGGADPVFFNSTANLRGWKGSVHEGGLRVPTIARWPGRIQPGAVTDFPSYFPDWFPTLCHIADVEIPETSALDGIDLTPALTGKPQPPRQQPMIWQFHGYGGHLAVIDGPWKAVREKVLTRNPGDWELYHLENDPSEATNLAAQHPEILTRLITAHRDNHTRNPHFPFPHYDSKPAE